jgi:hypothetical protein
VEFVVSDDKDCGVALDGQRANSLRLKCLGFGREIALKFEDGELLKIVSHWNNLDPHVTNGRLVIFGGIRIVDSRIEWSGE